MHILAYYLHHLDPYIFKIGPVGPRYYGVAYLLGFFFAYLLIQKLSRDGMLRLNPQLVPDMVLNGCIFGVLVGGRLGFVLFYDLPSALHSGQVPLLWDFSLSFPFWRVLRVWDGGMAAHGGVVFSILTLIWFARKYKASVINIGDAACMVVPIGLFFGRIANFINGELYGHPTTLPWAVRFPSEVYAPTNGVPTIQGQDLFPMKSAMAQFISENWERLSLPQVQAFLSDESHAEFRDSLTQTIGTLNLDKSATQLNQARQAIAALVRSDPDQISRWDIAAWWQQGHNGLTDFMATWFDKILPTRHPSQLYEALMEGLLLFIICWTIGRVWRKDGMASGAFLTLYPIMRIIGEQFRVGDTAVNGAIGAGILYSLPMFLGGAIYWGYFIARSKPRVWQPIPVEPAESATQPAKAPENP